MLGCSVYLGNKISKSTETYLCKMKHAGFNGIFSSLHIPEDDQSKYLVRVRELGELAKKLKMTLMLDVSEKAIESMGLSFENVSEFKGIGVTGIRMDYGISMSEIAKFSQEMTVGLNASTLTINEIDQLKASNANFQNMQVWHNYYPRPETGLGKKSFIVRNKWLQSLGFTVVAFSPGDEKLRGPLYEYLPTLEKHRGVTPLAATLELLKECHVDQVYISDERIKGSTLQQFSTYFNNNKLILRIQLFSSRHLQLILGEHSNRIDDAEDVVRSRDARFKQIPVIKEESTVERIRGSVTLDNQLYERYMGEVQITKKDLPSNPKINVVGMVIPEDIDLVDWIVSGQDFYLKEKEEF